MARPQAAGAADCVAFARFDRLREQVERNEAETDALVELGAIADPAADFGPPADADVEAELQSLKKQCG
ncbi:MAG: hypothetical protein HY290_10605 [Planctomycetia bacterium]|nr:hypothetical protein [Planctomycetia bacterium]